MSIYLDGNTVPFSPPLTTVVPGYVSFSSLVHVEYRPGFSHDISLGLDWSSFLRESLILSSYRRRPGNAFDPRTVLVSGGTSLSAVHSAPPHLAPRGNTTIGVALECAEECGMVSGRIAFKNPHDHVGSHVPVTNLHPEKEIIWHKTYEARKEQSRKSALLVPVQSASTSSTEQTDREGGISDGTAFRGISQRLETAIRDVDMQLAVLREVVQAHGLECDLAEDNIMVRLPDNVAAGDVTTWTAVFLTYTLGVLEIPDDYTGQSYILDVLKVDAMYKNMD
ncbi:hypothetical protein B0H13DRAFT_2657322 [Mycena leptocephala]|nr:hypothetical protein B0H13DRAFT_2657322 [Mycena leptocephala]